MAGNGKSFTYFLLVFLTSVFLITAFALVLNNNTGRCTLSGNGKSEKDCGEEGFDFLCVGPALIIDVTLPGSMFRTHRVCPWREVTSILTYVAFTFSMLFILSLGLTLWARLFNLALVQFIIGSIAIIVLLVSVGFMLYDVIYGDKAKDYITFIAVQTSQGVFITTLIVAFFGLITISMLMFATFTIFKKYTVEIAIDQEAPFHPIND